MPLFKTVINATFSRYIYEEDLEELLSKKWQPPYEKKDFKIEVRLTTDHFEQRYTTVVSEAKILIFPSR